MTFFFVLRPKFIKAKKMLTTYAAIMLTVPLIDTQQSINDIIIDSIPVVQYEPLVIDKFETNLN